MAFNWKNKAQVEEDKKNLIREFRNERLQSCDWTQLPDCGLTEAKKKAWAKYRQELRDMPAKTQNLTDPKWPTEPK